MKLVSMKITKKASVSSEKVTSDAPERPAYPWGLTVNLDTDALAKLGLKDDLPRVGTTMTLAAKVEVSSVSENKSLGGGEYCSVALQITHLGLSADPTVGADKLYDKKAG